MFTGKSYFHVSLLLRLFIIYYFSNLYFSLNFYERNSNVLLTILFGTLTKENYFAEFLQFLNIVFIGITLARIRIFTQKKKI